MTDKSFRAISASYKTIYGNLSVKKNIKPAEEWILDNYYIIEREHKNIRQTIKGKKKNHFLYTMAEKAVMECDCKTDEAAVENFLEKCQKNFRLRSDEITLFPTYLKIAIIGRIAELCSDIYNTDAEEIGNCIQSLVFLTEIDMDEKKEKFCACDVVFSEKTSDFLRLTSQTKELYRQSVCKMSKRSGRSEKEIAEFCVRLAGMGKDEREKNIGYYLIADGQDRLCKALGIKSPNTRRPKRLYIGLNIFFTVFLILLSVYVVHSVLGIFVFIFPILGISITISDFLLSRFTKPRILPSYNFEKGLPENAKTAVVYPVLLSGEESAEEICSRIEVCYMANREKNLVFAVLGDLKDSEEKELDGDARILGRAEEKITRLCEKYGDRFFLLVRKRKYNEKQNKWMGWERKRGALTQFCEFIRGKGGFDKVIGNAGELKNIKYVLTLDSDTVLPIGGAALLAGVAAHPLNRAKIDSRRSIVTDGYAVIKPKVSIEIESASKTMFSRIFAGQGGTDPYSSAVSDLYMDVFGEAIFTGKGIFDVDAYLTCAGRAIPENSVLSHDLLEGEYLRCALCSNAEVYDSYPSGFEAYSRRMHRWQRGDWQLLPWLFPKVRDSEGRKVKNELGALSKWKIADNLRRSVTPVFQTLILIFSCVIFPKNILFATGLVIASLVLPLVLYILNTFFSGGTVYVREKRNSNIIYGAKSLLFQFVLSFAFLAFEAATAADAVVRTVWRVVFTKKNTLQWVTAADAERKKSGGMLYYYRYMASSVAAGVLACLTVSAFGGEYAGISVIWAIIWIAAPAIAYIVGITEDDNIPLYESDKQFLLETAKRTWQFFADFTQSTDNFLPPDNVQIRPYRGAAHRTSPTNIGLYLASVVGARDLDFITTEEMEDRIANTLDTIERMDKWRGHLLNWYDTKSLRPLYPRYVSTVDSGNFTCYLMCVAEGLREYCGSRCENLVMRINRLVGDVRFGELFDSKKRLFSIGFNIEEGRLSPSYYDMLASEARQSVYLAVARGEIKPKDWFRLSRTLTGSDGYRGLLSWTGTMFEYFMPLLIMKNYKNTLLDEAYFFSLHCQKKYARKRRVPWGMSESAFFGFDVSLNYRYKAFGVPVLAVKKGIADDIVTAPYATMLALMRDTKSAILNLYSLKNEDAYGEYGFFEAIDYTPARTFGRRRMVVKSYMSHHQGMGFCAIVNVLCQNCMQRRFHSYPEIRAAQTLLQERVPVKVSLTHDIKQKITPVKVRWQETSQCVREFECKRVAPAPMHVLSNGTYRVVIDTRGRGISARDNVIFGRMRPDPCLEGNGNMIFVKTAGGDGISAYSGKCVFSPYMAQYKNEGDVISSDLKVCVMPQDCAELRQLSIVNNSTDSQQIEVTAYTDVTLDTYESESAHSVFSNLFVTTYYQDRTLFAERKPRGEHEKGYCGFYTAVCEGGRDVDIKYETDRAKFLGRGNDIFSALGNMDSGVGNVLDTCFALRITLKIDKGESACISFIAGICENMTLAEKTANIYRKRVNESDILSEAYNFERAQTVGLKEGDEETFLSILPYIWYGGFPHERQRDAIKNNKKSFKELWKMGISGDMPIVALRISDEGDLDVLEQMIRAYEYFLHKGIKIDLVVLCDEAVGYNTPLFESAREKVSESEISQGEGVFVLGGQEILPEDKMLIIAASRLFVDAKDGGLKLNNIFEKIVEKNECITEKNTDIDAENLIFDNTYGGFAEDGEEYVIKEKTPMPWVNVISNGSIGFVAGENGGGYTWYKNCHEMRLSAWHNDPVTDPPTEILGVYENGNLVAATTYQTLTRHGRGYTKYCFADDIEEILFAPREDGVKIIWIKIKNCSDQEKKYRLNFSVTPVLGENIYRMRGRLRAFLKGGCAVCENALSDGVGMFLWGADGSKIKLRATQKELDEGLGDDFFIEAENSLCIQPGNTGECVFLLGASENTDKIKMLVEKYSKNTGLHFEECKKFFSSLNNITVSTPDKSFDILVNHWLVYQSMSCRLFGRSGFYQSGGAYGFRDQLQDVLSVLYSAPDIARLQILRSAKHQFTQGDVMHWWHEGEPDKGVRTKISDDRLWLAAVVCEYMKATGDESILDEKVPYIVANPLGEGENERYFEVSERGAEESIYDHCKRAVDFSLNFGEKGLPLMGGGDWNDGMNRVGIEGKGESVWLGWFTVWVLNNFSNICECRGDKSSSEIYRKYAKMLCGNIDKNAWDGEWYKRAFFDDGEPLGSKICEECQIDSVSQSWAVISGGAQKDKAKKAIASALNRLADGDVIKLLAPPFDKCRNDPGYIKSYIPGVRENGGQYTHAAVWLAIACALLGMGEEASDIFARINPVNHAKTRGAADRFKTEPYVMAADVYSNNCHKGRGGWSWYTGAASWMYLLAVRYILGIEKKGNTLTVSPCVPKDWNEFSFIYMYFDTEYRITARRGKQISENKIELVADHKIHEIVIYFQ